MRAHSHRPKRWLHPTRWHRWLSILVNSEVAPAHLCVLPRALLGSTPLLGPAVDRKIVSVHKFLCHETYSSSSFSRSVAVSPACVRQSQGWSVSRRHYHGMSFINVHALATLSPSHVSALSRGSAQWAHLQLSSSGLLTCVPALHAQSANVKNAVVDLHSVCGVGNILVGANKRLAIALAHMLAKNSNPALLTSRGVVSLIFSSVITTTITNGGASPCSRVSTAILPFGSQGKAHICH